MASYKKQKLIWGNRCNESAVHFFQLPTDVIVLCLQFLDVDQLCIFKCAGKKSQLLSKRALALRRELILRPSSKARFRLAATSCSKRLTTIKFSGRCDKVSSSGCFACLACLACLAEPLKQLFLQNPSLTLDVPDPCYDTQQMVLRAGIPITRFICPAWAIKEDYVRLFASSVNSLKYATCQLRDIEQIEELPTTCFPKITNLKLLANDEEDVESEFLKGYLTELASVNGVVPCVVGLQAWSSLWSEKFEKLVHSVAPNLCEFDFKREWSKGAHIILRIQHPRSVQDRRGLV